MPASVWNLRPLQREPETREFKDPEQPEWHLTLTLRPVDGVTATKYAVMKAELLRKHVTGLRGADGELVKDKDGNPIQEPVPITCGDFQKRFPDEFVVDRYCKLVAMWAVEGEEPPHLMEVIGWQTLLYTAWFEIANWIEDVYNSAGQVKGGTTAASSAASSTSTESTQKSPSEETPSCAASKGASGKPLGNSAECAAPQPAAAA